MDGESQLARDARVRRLFQKLDRQQKGYLDLNGLKSGLAGIEHPLQNADHLLKDVLKAVDKNSDGRIQWEEFRVFVEETEKELWVLFHSIDRDNNGAIDRSELAEAFKKAGITMNTASLENFFHSIDKNGDGRIEFEEWRDFLLFLPQEATSMRAIYSYYQSTSNVNPEGDVIISDQTMEGLGYFLAGGNAGVVSRTITAPFDRLKVYLIARTDSFQKTVQEVKNARVAELAKKSFGPLRESIRDIYKAGGIRSFFAGNGLNVIKVLPESAIKFGSYEATKRLFGQLEGCDPENISSISRFLAGGVGGVVSQFAVYPIDTLKFRMQSDLTSVSSRGNKLILETATKMWASEGTRSFYKGLPLGLIGIFPYSAIDLGLFGGMKNLYIRYHVSKSKCNPEDIKLSNVAILSIGATSGSIGASIVYPMNLLRTRLQAQGTAAHPQTYSGMSDVFTKTLRNEGFKGMFRGLTPNLLKVAPAVSISYLVYEKSKNAMGLK